MKVLVIGDPHFRFELPYSSSFTDGRRSEWEAVKKTIHDEAQSCDAIVLMGDNLNLRHNHSAVIDEFIAFLKGFGDKQLHILVGNHEVFGKKTALDFLKSVEYPNWEVYKEPTLAPLVFGTDIKAMFVPYLSPYMLDAENKEDGVTKAIEALKPAKLAFFHQGITGASVHGTMVDLFNEIVLPRENLEALYDHVFSGHIHGAERLSDKTIMTGSIFTAEVGEPGKSIWTWEDGAVTEIPLPMRGIYKFVVGKTIDGLFNLVALTSIPTNSIVKCIVTDKSVVLDEVREALKRFDAFILIEQYPNERSKAHFEDGAPIDLSIEGLLKIYAESKNVPLEDLREGFELIK